MINEKYLIWSYLRCFDHDKEDFGVAGLVYHPDFVHLHRGMEEEFSVPPQMFGYRGAPDDSLRKPTASTHGQTIR